MADFTFNLSRWHAVAERLRALGEAKRQEAVQVLGATTLEDAPTEEQVEALRQRGARALEQVEEARQAMQAVGAIREALARANVEAGVSQLLSELEAKRQEARFLAELSGIDLLTKVPIQAASERLREKARDAASSYRGVSVAVSLVPTNALDRYREQRAVLDAEVASLLDRVNDANRKTLTLSLNDSLARAVGLSMS